MNKLSTEEKVRVVACLVEGNSLRSTVRMTGIHRTTIQNLLVDLGNACAEYQDSAMRNLKCKRVECDEIWSFCGSKEKNTKPEMKAAGWGDVWTWVAIDPVTKLVPCWHVGNRTPSDAYWFIHDLKDRLASRTQLTTDGLKFYVQAVEDAFGSEIDYAQLIKLYGIPGRTGQDHPTEVRYSPPECIGERKIRVQGNPDKKYVSTSIVERQNLTMRTGMRRFTRLTNGFSKKVANHRAAIALHYFYYNFARIHQTLRVTPAMEVGISDHVWSLEEMVKLLK
ncbi:MAG: IS1 family transposase [Verrucomicrobiota bacterium]|jgi:IS1 family transposase